jgi:hypothetical protein
VPPWGDAEDPDFHGTLAAIWIWARHQHLSGDARFAAHRAAAWAFVEGSARRFIPDAIGSAASDEAAYDCAMVLLAHDADRGLDAGNGRRQLLADGAARLLSSYLSDFGDVDDHDAREFRDPGFLAWALIGYARTVEDRGLLASGRRFVERAFGMNREGRADDSSVARFEPETQAKVSRFLHRIRLGDQPSKNLSHFVRHVTIRMILNLTTEFSLASPFSHGL